MTTSHESRKTLIRIPNRHVDDVDEFAYVAGTYISYFENELGDQWLFVRERGADTATVYGGDVGWEGREVTMRSWTDVRARLEASGARKSMVDQIIAMMRPEPLVPDLVLANEEKAWLNLAWATSCTPEQRDAELALLADWIAEQMPDDLLEKHPNTQEYRAGIQALALLTGRIAGARGFDEAGVTKLYGAVNEALRSKQ